jgi:uncharacterized membrane protein YgdD (TMEM256/DUF423 family)
MLNDKWASSLVMVAALAGAAGVAEAAYAAHGAADPLLQISSHFLVLHAAAVIAIAAFAFSCPTRSKALLLSGSLLMFGTLLFCGDLSAKAMIGGRLFPMAAPIGGSLQIIGWLSVATSALLRLSKRSL